MWQWEILSKSSFEWWMFHCRFRITGRVNPHSLDNPYIHLVYDIQLFTIDIYIYNPLYLINKWLIPMFMEN